MTDPVRLGIIGSGNIVRTRHLPALKALMSRVNVIGISDTHADRARDVARAFGIPHYDSNGADSIDNVSWLDRVDAVVIATPPLSHGNLVGQALSHNKHVLVEKPFVVDLEQGESVLALARGRNLILAVNHNFQYSRGFTSLAKDLARHRMGDLRGVYSLQLSNGTRRLPNWSESLPFGLFYDESPHVFYLLTRFAGAATEINSVYALKSSTSRSTPHLLSIELTAGSLPASIHVDFESPICEWCFAVLGDRGVGYVDLFRDIYAFLPNDGQHLMLEVLRTSAYATLQHWRNFLNNGWSYVRGSLYYGFDTIYSNFAAAVSAADRSYIAEHSGESGLSVNQLQHAVITRAGLSPRAPLRGAT